MRLTDPGPQWLVGGRCASADVPVRPGEESQRRRCTKAVTSLVKISGASIGSQWPQRPTLISSALGIASAAATEPGGIDQRVVLAVQEQSRRADPEHLRQQVVPHPSRAERRLVVAAVAHPGAGTTGLAGELGPDVGIDGRGVVHHPRQIAVAEPAGEVSEPVQDRIGQPGGQPGAELGRRRSSGGRSVRRERPARGRRRRRGGAGRRASRCRRPSRCRPRRSGGDCRTGRQCSPDRPGRRRRR